MYLYFCVSRKGQHVIRISDQVRSGQITSNQEQGNCSSDEVVTKVVTKVKTMQDELDTSQKIQFRVCFARAAFKTMVDILLFRFHRFSLSHKIK